MTAVTSTVLIALVVVGTLVTASGPHGGDPGTPRLAAVAFGDLVTAHAHLLFAFLGLLVGLGFLLHAVHAPRPVLVRFRLLVLVTLAQGVLGGVQYALAVPELLVVLHVLGATLTVVSCATLWASTRTADPDPASSVTADRVLAGAS